MLTFLKSRSRWIVAPVAGVTAAAALATVALASGSLPGDFLNAANTTHRTCRTNPRPALTTAASCGQGIAALINREHKLAAGGNSRLPIRIPAGMSGPAQSPVSAAELARLRNFKQVRTALWGG